MHHMPIQSSRMRSPKHKNELCCDAFMIDRCLAFRGLDEISSSGAWVYILPAGQGWLLLRGASLQSMAICAYSKHWYEGIGMAEHHQYLSSQGRPGNGTVCVHLWDGFLGGSGTTKVHRTQYLNFDAHISTMNSSSSQLWQIEQCMTSEDIYDSWKHRPGSEGC